MKIRLPIPVIIITTLLVGCSDHQNEQPQENNTVNKTTQNAPSPHPKQDIKTISKVIPPSSPLKDVNPQDKEPITQKKIEQDAKALADALAYEGDSTPREELELELKKILEAAANAESTTAENKTQAQ